MLVSQHHLPLVSHAVVGEKVAWIHHCKRDLALIPSSLALNMGAVPKWLDTCIHI